MIPTREEAIKILDEMVENENLKKHMYAVEAVMRAYAKKYHPEDKEAQDKWAIAGLLHDADWEKHPKEHPQVIVQKLHEMEVDEEICQAIASHGDNSPQYPDNHFEERTSLMERALFASDEISGFVIACALVRPDKLDSLEVKSVKKKLKDKGFAAQVNRDDIINGAKDLEVDLDQHIELVIKTLRGINDVFGF